MTGVLRHYPRECEKAAFSLEDHVHLGQHEGAELISECIMADQLSKTSGEPIEFWFDFGSNYSYLSVMRVVEQGIDMQWQPFLLGPIFQSFGWSNSPFVLQKAKGEYVWRDMERQCRKYGIPWRQPTEFPRLGVLPLRIMLVGEGQPWVGEFARLVMLRNFHLDQEIQSSDAMTAVLAELGLPAADLIAKAQSDSIKARLREQTDTAMRRKVFGAPTFFAKGEMFWGNDRLEDALRFASEAES
jgi:2-hydroxychromene-2-carboxylate isomerase